MLARIGAIFKSIAAQYKKLQEMDAAADDEEDDEDDADEGPQEKQLGHHKSRKSRKCEERLEALVEAGIKISAKFRFFFQPRYQSTEESDTNAVIDPDTDTEETAEIPARSTIKPWISRPPTYRSAILQAGIDKVDKVVMDRREAIAINNPGKTTSHARIRGPPKDVRLPCIDQKKLRISRDAISAEWLAAHPEDDTPSRIHVEGEDDDGDDEDSDEEDSASD
ncbi:hypothetical protein B0H10DRAFT_2237077 [Mycena sp. CBHHK59/15]|nr:hypothetical protein B0H10DRAFT_2237077 [Mycena sp. CBHHK59/15]